MDKLRRILLVDDSPRDTEMALNALEQYHLANEVLTLRDGTEALDYLYRRGEFAGRTNGNPAVILLDLKMPKVDGFEVLRQIKGDPKLKVIPVVVMTSSREERDLIDSYQLGVNAYVVKPLKFTEFVDAVRQVGGFWAVLNEPPPGSLRRTGRTRD
jgi:CheY-like chemotaxis protein